MRSGEGGRLVCASRCPVAGARSLPLGNSRYLAVPGRICWSAIAAWLEHRPWALAPAYRVLGPDDQLQTPFLAHAAMRANPLSTCVLASEGFVAHASAGIGLGMVPALQIRRVSSKAPVARDNLPGQAVEVARYWHYCVMGRFLRTKTDQSTGHRLPQALLG